MKNLKLYLLAAGLTLMSALAYAQPSSTCQDWKYFFADITPAGTDIYRVNLNITDADLTYIATDSAEVHIAYNESDKLLYLVRKMDGAVRTLTTNGPVVFGSWNLLTTPIPDVVAAAFDASNTNLIIGSQSLDKLYSVTASGSSPWLTAIYDYKSPIYGGDLEFDANGDLYFSSGTKLYKNAIDPLPDTYIGVLNPNNRSTGLALMKNGNLISSYAFSNQLRQHTTAAIPGVTPTYDLKIGGVPHMAQNGDMTSGCGDNFNDSLYCQPFYSFYIHHGPGLLGSDLYGVVFSGSVATLTLLVHVSYEAHIAYNAALDIVYLVNKNGGAIESYSVIPGTLSGPAPLSPTGITEVTAVVYNELNGYLYVGSGNQDIIYEVDLGFLTYTPFASAPVSGGDLAMKNNKMYLATRANSELHMITGPTPGPIGTIQSNVTGLIQANNNNGLITSNYNSTNFIEIDASNGSFIKNYAATLGGNQFTLLNGDMAAGCVSTPAPNPKPSTKIGQFRSNQKNGLKSYPNPTTGKSEVVFETLATGTTTLEVIDMRGRTVATLFNAVADQDQEYSLNFDGSSLPNGIYIYKLTTKNEVVMSKFMIAR